MTVSPCSTCCGWSFVRTVGASPASKNKQHSCIVKYSLCYCLYSRQRLQLNPDKTELIWFCSRANLLKLKQLDINLNLNICSVIVEPFDSVSDLSAILDSELSMQKHTSKISSICFFHFRRLWKIHPLINSNSTQRLVSAFILSWVDYCNDEFTGLLASTLASLQRVLKVTARFVADTVAHTPYQRYYEVITLAADRLLDTIQTVCPHDWCEQRNQYGIPVNFVRHHYTDHINAWSLSAPLCDDHLTRRPMHEDKIRRQRILCGWTTRMD